MGMKFGIEELTFSIPNFTPIGAMCRPSLGCRKTCKLPTLANLKYHCLCSCSCSLAVLDPRVGHTMDVLSPFIPVLCHSDWLFHRESCPRLDVVHPGQKTSTSMLKQTTKHITKEKNKQLHEKDISISTMTMRTRLTCNALLSQSMQQKQKQWVNTSVWTLASHSPHSSSRTCSQMAPGT